jgi:uncharacterized membrane protein
VGWDWHQRQQRAAVSGDQVVRRQEDVRAIYTQTDPAVATNLLKRYGVNYVYVGPVERIYYPGPGLDKFDRLAGTFWERVYADGQVSIYRVP